MSLGGAWQPPRIGRGINGYGRQVHVPTLVKTALATGAAAVVGSVTTNADSAWYRSLDKPRWQPPSAAFPLVWTPLYTLIALAGARALNRLSGPERAEFRRRYATDLALNAAWSAVFFRLRNPKLALAEIAALNAANLALLRRAWQADRRAAAMLLPYLAWTCFATTLNASIAARNPGHPPDVIDQTV